MENVEEVSYVTGRVIVMGMTHSIGGLIYGYDTGTKLSKWLWLIVICKLYL